jgi:hypothetical protein
MRAALLLLLLTACPAPLSRPPAPAVPVLVEAPELQRRRVFTLRGSAADDVTVRIFVDTACAGPVYLQTTGAGLVQGVPVELVAGADNVFSVDAVSSRGISSPCSPPLRVRYLPSVPPGRPSLDSRPPSPSRELHFQLVGAADLGTRVQLHAFGGCDNPVLAELSATAFFEVGFPVEVPENGTAFFSVAAVNEDSASTCVSIVLINDRTPPQFLVRLGSPTPSPQREAWLLFSGEGGGGGRDAVNYELYAGAGCTGELLGSCAGCVVLPAVFPPDTSTPFSVRGTDSVGNTGCVAGPEPWVHDPSLPDEEAPVLSPGSFLYDFPRIQVAYNRPLVQAFLSPDCSGLAVLARPASELIYNGVYVTAPEDGGFVTARSFRSDGGWDPCSNALYVGP